ncbi:MAG: DUF2147 domain-containing protein, partial [Bacteroidota bacterium]
VIQPHLTVVGFPVSGVVNGPIAVLAPRVGKTYNSKMWLDDNNTLMMRGYLGPFYRTVELTRVQ